MNVHRSLGAAAGDATADPRPRSAVSGGVGLAGLAGFALALGIGIWLDMNGPVAGMLAVVITGIPMVLWTVFVDKTWRRPSTGLDFAASARPHDETREISVTKLAGLWATFAIIGTLYCLGRWYWGGQYLFAMQVLAWTAPVLFLVSIPYIFWIDRRMIEPKDGCYMFGHWLMGGDAIDRDKVIGHFRSWAVKGFFTAFMISIVPGNWFETIRQAHLASFGDPVALASFLIILLFLIDVVFATVGYVLTMRPLDSHIRSANPYAQGWTAALICYPPFILMGAGGPLDYQADDGAWTFWLAGHPAALYIWGALLVTLTGIYGWATVAFGIRFSNLTHRGILTHGPYSLSRHPAYLAKNCFWWLGALPFLPMSGSLIDMVRNTAIIAAVSGVYYWRAKTEEKHLMGDPAYQTYWHWMQRNAPIPRLFAKLTRRSAHAMQPEVAAAE